MRETVTAESVSARMKRSPRWHGRQPADVLLNLEISDRASRVYGVLSLKTFQGNVSSIGLRQLAALFQKSPATMMRAIRELELAGKVRIRRGRNGQRASYELVSPVFGSKQRAGVEEVMVSGPGRRRLATVRKDSAREERTA